MNEPTATAMYCVRRLAATCFGGADPDTQSLLDSRMRPDWRHTTTSERPTAPSTRSHSTPESRRNKDTVHPARPTATIGR
eukprot:scaffold16483_cov73-Phaeocystis_antarctica.AAC.1